MTQTLIQKGFAPLKRFLPKRLANFIRGLITGVMTPFLTSYRTGHFLSSLKMASLSRDGSPIPWYTYPCIDFLRFRDFSDKKILEFGGGNSTLWWSKKASEVTTFEGNPEWFNKLSRMVSDNVCLNLITMADRESCVREVADSLSAGSVEKFDVIVLDGLFRENLLSIAFDRIAADGMIIVDNAESYDMFNLTKNCGFSRIDFYGSAPGVVLQHCTSLFFKSSCFAFSSQIPIKVISKE